MQPAGSQAPGDRTAALGEDTRDRAAQQLFCLGTSETQQIWRCVSDREKLGNNGFYKSQNNGLKIEKFSQIGFV